jgi:multiple sugar transport system substrate-binding protein
MGIPGNAKNKEAAFLFIQWMTTKRADRRMVELGGDPIRISTLKDPQFSKKFPEYPVIAEQLKCADPDWRPLIPEWNELNIKVLGLALTEVITTEKPIKPIMDKAAAKARAVMEREGYYQWANLKK